MLLTASRSPGKREQNEERLKNMRKRRITFKAASAAISLILSFALCGNAQQKHTGASGDGRDVTILVTAHPHNDRTRAEALKLRPDDFAVREEKQPQKIISVIRATEAPPIIAVLLHEELQ